MSTSQVPTESTGKASPSNELCAYCLERPHTFVCTCGEKYDSFCVQLHAEQINQEFQHVQNTVGQRLIEVEQIVDDDACEDAKTFVENWVRIEYEYCSRYNTCSFLL